MFDYAIINARIVDEETVYCGNIYIKDGKFAAITDPSVILDCITSTDAQGKFVFPGLVDSHSHLGDPVSNGGRVEIPRTATTAAAVGGFTTVIDMPNNHETILNAERFEKKLEYMRKECMVDFALYGAIVKDNQDKLEGLHNAGAAAFKSFLACGGGDFTYPTMYEALKALQAIKEFNGLACFHCEDTTIIEGLLAEMKEKKLNSRQAFFDSRPLYSENMATSNMIELAKATGCRLQICHVSHPEVAALIEKARDEGVDVTGETCVHYLVFNEEDLLEKGCTFKCAPPLRSREASYRLWHYVENGTLSCLGSDHSPGLPEERDDSLRPVYDLNNGISGIQTVLQCFFNAAVVERHLSPTLIASRMSAGPARRFGLYGKKGAIRPGFDADLVMLDPDKEWTIKADDLYYIQKFSAFEGMQGKGLPVLTLLRGKAVAMNYKACVSDGYAQFVTPVL